MRFISNDFNEIYYNLVSKLTSGYDYQVTTRKGDKIYEIIDFNFTLKCPKKCFATMRDMSLKYLNGELKFYLSGSPFLKDIVKHSKFWQGVTDDSRTVFSNYGKLILHDRNHHNYTQFEYARDMLIKNKESKKAVLVLYSKENAHPSNDNPCTMFLQFFIRKNKLDLYVKMRSSDVWFGLPYDVPFFCLIQMKMLNDINAHYNNEISLGTYNHSTGSAHLYERHYEKVIESLDRVKKLEDLSDYELLKFKDYSEIYIDSLFKEMLLPYIEEV